MGRSGMDLRDMNELMADLRKVKAENAILRKRLEALEKLAEFSQHLPGCMEPGLCDEDCACGYWEAKQSTLAAGEET